MSFTASTTMGAATLPIVRAEDQCWKQFKPVVSVPAGLQPLGMQSQVISNSRCLIYPVQAKRASIICGAALNVRCAQSQGQSQSQGGQTQTITRESSTITVAPGKENPELDDGGSGFPPRDDDGGGGGGGGGGGWAGGFFFFGFLALLGLLKDQEDEGTQQNHRRR